MFKNVAASFMVFAFDATTNVPKTGDAANITAYVSKDYGTVTVLGDTSATEMDATNAPGYYLFAAAQAETNADCLMVSAKSATANIKVLGAPAVIYTRPTTGWLAPTTAGRTLDVSAGGEAGLDWANVGSPTTSLALTGTTIAVTQKVDVETIKTNPVVNGGTITFPTTATLASTTNITAGTVTTATNVTTVNGLAAGVITAASIAANAITAAKLDPDVTTELQSGLATAAALATVDGIVDDILVDTGTTLQGELDGIQATLGVAGAGLTAVVWNAAWDAEVESEVTDALNAYDPPTNAEMVARTIASASYATASALATAAGNIDAILVDTGTTLQGELDALQVILEKLDDTLEDDAGTFRFTTNALEQAPSGTGASAATIADAVWDEARAGHVGAGSFGEGVIVVTNSDKTGYRLSTTGVDDLWDEVVDGSITGRQAMRILSASQAGKLSGAATTTITIRDPADTADRIVATVDAAGNRSAVTLTL